MNDRSQYCATCGKPRGMDLQRESWSFSTTPIVPRPETGTGGWQITNDLIVHAGIYRNGGTNEECHLCNDCLRVGLVALRSEIDRLLGETGDEATMRAQLAETTEKLGSCQHSLHNLQYDYKRDLKRLALLVDGKNPSSEEKLWAIQLKNRILSKDV